METLKYPIFIDIFDTMRHHQKSRKTINLETSNQQVEGSIPSGVAIFYTRFGMCGLTIVVGLTKIACMRAVLCRPFAREFCVVSGNQSWIFHPISTS
jgi:hypothetical protein